MPVRARLATALVVLAATSPAQAERVICHVSYGGETRQIEANPTDNPYTVPVIEFGSILLFRIVHRTAPADLASVKLYTYAGLVSGPVIVHQASHPLPLAAAQTVSPDAPKAAYGFTGLNFVYEPLRDGELQYWCEMTDEISK